MSELGKNWDGELAQLAVQFFKPVYNTGKKRSSIAYILSAIYRCKVLYVDVSIKKIKIKNGGEKIIDRRFFFLGNEKGSPSELLEAF